MRLVLPLVTIVALVFIASACKGVCDTLQFHYSTSFAADYENEQWWNPESSWRNKWKVDEAGQVIKPKHERFPGSSTVFVFRTDAWHFFQMIQYRCYDLARTLCLLYPMIQLREVRWWMPVGLMAVFWIIHAAGFHLTYTLL